jgi:hypothetical protein
MAYSQVMKDHALASYCEKYMNFAATFAVGKMFEEDASFTMHHETLVDSRGWHSHGYLCGFKKCVYRA